jgi:hypothetical protein
MVTELCHYRHLRQSRAPQNPVLGENILLS